MKEYIFKHKLLLILTVGVRIVGSIMQVFIAILIQQVIDVAVLGDMNKFVSLLIFSMAYFMVMGLVDYLTSTTQAIYLKKTLIDLKKDLFKGLMAKDYENYMQHNTADYLSHLTNDLNLVETNYITPYLMMIGDAVIFVLTVVVLVWINPWVTLSMFLLGGLLIIIPSLFGKKLEYLQNHVSDQLSVFTTNVKDILQGYEVVKSYQMMDTVSQEFDEINNGLETAKFKSAHLKGIAQAVSMIFAIATQIAGMAIGGYFVIMGSMTVGSLFAVVQLGNGIQGPIMWIMQKVTLIKGMKGINAKLSDIIEVGRTQETKESLTEFQDKIALQNISFSYDQEKIVLNNLSITFEKGKKYAIVGGSGCGKTTLVKLIMGYYQTYEGQILIDGKDVQSPKRFSLHQLASMIHQNVYLFDKDIESNIVLGETFSEHHLQKAMARSGVLKFVNSLSNGIKSAVGENGKNLSGGQKQRVAIARALIQETPILILDEGTSALDNQTAFDIENTLLNLSELTVLTITHKLNEEILSQYDQIIVMDSGEIVQSGTYKELASVEGEFKTLMTLLPKEASNAA
ncbi:MAG TPA: ABC transporter ATP-binding protein [Firmicutes bacterium]|nr:ABC transporter ATP-binding protein [Bacillota bacterium]